MKDIAAVLNDKSLVIVGISGLDRFDNQIITNLQLLDYGGKIYGFNPCTGPLNDH